MTDSSLGEEKATFNTKRIVSTRDFCSSGTFNTKRIVSDKDMRKRRAR